MRRSADGAKADESHPLRQLELLRINDLAGSLGSQRAMAPVTDEVIRWHLSGQDDGGQPFVAGVYPLLLDETCYFLAVDFDKADWQSDAMAFVQGCRRLGLSAALERSRSGSRDASTHEPRAGRCFDYPNVNADERCRGALASGQCQSQSEVQAMIRPCRPPNRPSTSSVLHRSRRVTP